MKRPSFLDESSRLTKGGSMPRSPRAPAANGRDNCAPRPITTDKVEEDTADPLTAFLKDAIREKVENDATLQKAQSLGSAESIVQHGDDVRGKIHEAGELEPTLSDAHLLPRWKRVFDLLCIAATCPIWLPLMLVAMIAVKLSSPGPVIYRQERIGHRGKRFMLYKFRSMRTNADTARHAAHVEGLMRDGLPMIKLDATGDPRIIPWGKLLRATGLDELPQIFNIIRGEMSVVGPRPCTVTEFERYQPWHLARVNAQPGLTGYWQVCGKNRTTFNEMIEMDICYAKQISLWLDIKIVMRTLPVLAKQVSELAKAHPRLGGGSPAARSVRSTTIGGGVRGSGARI
jgi:lipopolysaccharide/colanic/teichoic acid biosynthesis glycosyltransferase